MKNTKILFVCSARSWGGNEKWTSMAMDELAKNNEVSLCYRNEQLARLYGEKITKFTAPFVNHFDMITYWKITQFCLKNQIEFIVSTKRKEYFICGIISKMLRINHVIRLGIVRDMNIPFWHWLVYHRLNNGIIVNAQRIKDNLLRYTFMKPEKIKVIYNGINPCKIVNNEDHRRRNKKFVITSVGMLTKRKGFHHLIEAISYLWDERFLDLQVNILGSGESEFYLKKLTVQHNLSKIIHFHGFCNNVQEIVSQSDLFVLLSKNEGISNALLEAMNCGIPVLTTPAGGVKEFVRHGINGFLAEKADYRNIARILAEILFTVDNLKEIGETGKETVLTLFSRDRMRLEIEEFLWEVSH